MLFNAQHPYFCSYGNLCFLRKKFLFYFLHIINEMVAYLIGSMAKIETSNGHARIKKANNLLHLLSRRPKSQIQ